jgi:hypothetical protein
MHNSQYKFMADNRVVAEGEDGYFNGTTGLSVGLHFGHDTDVLIF